MVPDFLSVAKILIIKVRRPNFSTYLLNSDVTSTTEQSDDRGYIFIKDNEVEIVEDIIVNPGPSWTPERFIDRASFETLRSLVESADSEGMLADLTVVSAAPGAVLQETLPKLEDSFSLNLPKSFRHKTKAWPARLALLFVPSGANEGYARTTLSSQQHGHAAEAWSCGGSAGASHFAPGKRYEVIVSKRSWRIRSSRGEAFRPKSSNSDK
jgi:hypothetical protein